jgi:hypothetical protein
MIEKLMNPPVMIGLGAFGYWFCSKKDTRGDSRNAIGKGLSTLAVFHGLEKVYGGEKALLGTLGAIGVYEHFIRGREHALLPPHVGWGDQWRQGWDHHDDWQHHDDWRHHGWR